MVVFAERGILLVDPGGGSNNPKITVSAEAVWGGKRVYGSMGLSPYVRMCVWTYGCPVWMYGRYGRVFVWK